MGLKGIELKGRLKAIADKLPVCGTLIDIGTDHAYIPIYAVSEGICENAIAADVRPGPVEIARKNISVFGLEKGISVCLGNGLEGVRVCSGDVIVIAGMGGNLIAEILGNSCEKAQKAGLLILQPMNAAEVLRRWLYDGAFEIIDEVLAEEEDKLYNIICARWTDRKTVRDDFECYIGRELLDLHREDPAVRKYLLKKLGLLDEMIKGRECSKNNKEGLDHYRRIRDRTACCLDNLNNV